MIVNICLLLCRENARREVIDALGDLRKGILERLLSTEAQRIRDRPVGITHSNKLLMGVIAHSHHEVPLLRHLIKPSRRKIHEVHAMAAGYLDGAPGDALRGMGSRRYRRDFACLLPERGRQLGPCTVAGADEEDAAGTVLSPWLQARQGANSKPNITAAPIRFGAVAGYQPGLCQSAKVVGQQIRGHAQLRLQLRWREVAHSQQVNDAEPRRVRQGGMLGYALAEFGNCLNIH